MKRNITSRFARRSSIPRRAFRASIVATLVGLTITIFSATALADADGTIVQNFFTATTINEGSSVNPSLSLSISPASGGGNAATGTTTRRLNSTTINFSAPSSVQGSSSATAGSGANATETWNGSALTYNNDGFYTISYSQAINYNQTETTTVPSATSPGSVNTSAPGSGSVILTVLNVAPQNLNLSLSSATVNEGSSITASMTATDPGSDSLTFTIGGNPGGVSGNTTPGATRSSNVVTLGPFTQTGGPSTVVNITGSVNDGTATSNTSVALTVLNLPPVIDSLTIFSQVPAGPGTDNLQFASTAHDPGGDTLSISWDLDNNGVYGEQPGNNPTTPVAYYLGTHTIGVQWTDGDGGVSTALLTFTVIPEPSSLVLLGLGGAFALGVFRRRKSR